MVRVIDLGSGENPDPRATETVDLNSDADYTFDLNEKWPFEDNSVDGLIATHVIEHLDAHHVMQEADRVLKEHGWFEITVPLGISQRSDPTHTWYPTYESLEILSREFSDSTRPWDPDVSLTLKDRTVRVGFLPPLSPLSVLLQLFSIWFPRMATELAQTGEMTARYRC